MDIVQSGVTFISDVRPSTWTEQNMIMGKPFPGPFRYDRTPYTREIVDCLAPDHPAHTIVGMKGGQIGFSSGVIIPGICWIIKNSPGNTYLSVGAPDLIEKAMTKLDMGIDSTGIRDLIKPQVQRKRNNKTGDTNFKKEFPNGYVSIGSANNHKNIRQDDYQYVFLDDLEAIKKSSKQSGDTIDLIKQRLASYYGKSKLFLISTPEVKSASNIEPAYLLGDQRKYLVPCPHCKEPIELRWSTPSLKDENKLAGIYWEHLENGQVDVASVGYICQCCGGFFDDKNKHELLNAGFWKPTAIPSSEGYFSYHISSLYAPIGMYDWAYYVNQYVIANPKGQPRIEEKHKTFMNMCLGETYEEVTEDVKVADLQQKNIRSYTIGTLPEKMSEKDGNGKIVALICTADMNGSLDDARLDYEVVGWTESGATYSVTQGSIGTFVAGESGRRNKEDRSHWTYQANKTNSVWPEFKKILGQQFATDTGRQMRIMLTGLDTGHCKKEAYEFIDGCNFPVVGLKGEKEMQFIKFGVVVPNFKIGKERSNLWLLQVNQIKDQLANLMRLKWDEGNDDSQPAGFLNFPQPGDGKYSFKDYFSHFESEHRVIERKDGEGVASRWMKKKTNSQNHFWDCKVYQIGTRDILLYKFFKELNIKEYNWNDFCDIMLGRRRSA